MSDECENPGSAVADAFIAWTLMEKRFLSALVAQIIEDVPAFDGEKFVTRLYALQEILNPHTEDEAANRHMRLGLQFLGEMIEGTEEALHSRGNPSDIM